MSEEELLRLEADDPDVLALTGLALYDSLAIPDPPLRLACQQCGVLLAQAGVNHCENGIRLPARQQ